MAKRKVMKFTQLVIPYSFNGSLLDVETEKKFRKIVQQSTMYIETKLTECYNHKYALQV